MRLVLFVILSESEGSIGELCLIDMHSGDRCFTFVQHDKEVITRPALKAIPKKSPDEPGYILYQMFQLYHFLLVQVSPTAAGKVFLGKVGVNRAVELYHIIT